mgnify:CR=1 FL=1|tara:strand:- start:801 stop:1199 length:399 start_codon:yes stop_codon:yes gene_type:complete
MQIQPNPYFTLLVKHAATGLWVKQGGSYNKRIVETARANLTDDILSSQIVRTNHDNPEAVTDVLAKLNAPKPAKVTREYWVAYNVTDLQGNDATVDLILIDADNEAEAWYNVYQDRLAKDQIASNPIISLKD